MGRADYTWLAVLLANGYNIIDSVKKVRCTDVQRTFF